MRNGARSREQYTPLNGVIPRAGFTLVELIVVLAIMGLMAGISGLAMTSLRPPRESVCAQALRRARAAAIRTGQPTRAEITPGAASDCSVLPAPMFLPDGRALGTGVDPLTGAPRVRQ